MELDKDNIRLFGINRNMWLGTEPACNLSMILENKLWVYFHVPVQEVLAVQSLYIFPSVESPMDYTIASLCSNLCTHYPSQEAKHTKDLFLHSIHLTRSLWGKHALLALCYVSIAYVSILTWKDVVSSGTTQNGCQNYSFKWQPIQVLPLYA